MVRRLGLAAAVFGAALGLFAVAQAGVGGAQTTPTTAPAPAASGGDPGTVLYLRDCAWCHGTQGEGTSLAPPVDHAGAASVDFMVSSGRMPIPRPETQPPRGPVPYTPEEIAAIVAHVAGFGAGPPIPALDLATADLGDGAKVYADNCEACHGSVGSGATLTSGLVAPSLRHSTPTQVAEAVRIGGQGPVSGHMPRFGPDVITDQQLNDVVAYVQAIREPEDRGGAGLGHVGPIPEGLVAWGIGLLGIVLVLRWIGTKA